MILINLLPEEQRHRIRNQKIKNFVSTISVLIFILAVAFLGLIFLSKTLLGVQLTSLDKQVSEGNQKIDEMKEEKEMLEEYNASLALAQKFSEKQIPWTEILSEIARSTPVEVQISDISADLSKSNQMTIKGRAASRRAVVKFTDKLEASDNFSNVKFISSEKEETETPDTKCTFEISLSLDVVSKIISPQTQTPTNQPTSSK